MNKSASLYFLDYELFEIAVMKCSHVVHFLLALDEPSDMRTLWPILSYHSEAFHGWAF